MAGVPAAIDFVPNLDAPSAPVLGDNTQSLIARLTEQVSKQVSCDDECQANNTSDALRAAWKLADTRYKQGESFVRELHRKYLNQAMGESKANDYLAEQFKAVAIKDVKDEVARVSEENSENAADISTLRVLSRTGQSLQKLNSRLAAENKELSKAHRSTIAEVQTNDQRVVYGEAAKAWAVFYYWIALTVYFAAYVVFLWKGPFMQDPEGSGYATRRGWVMPLALLALGIFSRSITNMLMSAYGYFSWVLSNRGPKDAYVDMR